MAETQKSTVDFFDARDLSRYGGLFVSRVKWQQEFKQRVRPLRWIRSVYGLWFVYETTSYDSATGLFWGNDAGTFGSGAAGGRIATAADIQEEDLRATDWTTQYLDTASTPLDLTAAVAAVRGFAGAGGRGWGTPALMAAGGAE
ncbi:MAG: hypothetical protein WCO60_18315 [Verrucomicrobiota bacterium]